MLWTCFNIRASFRRTHRIATSPSRVVPDWRALETQGHRIGSADATVSVVVFLDYRCAACRILDRRLEKLRQRNPQQVAIVFLHFPVSPSGLAAARAAECASMLGRFPSFHRSMLADTEAFTDATPARVAASAGIGDQSAYERCLSDSMPMRAVDRDYSTGERIGVVATPTILVNGAMYVGVPWDLERIVLSRVDTEAGSM
jgi:protein-disulfide isomerase